MFFIPEAAGILKLFIAIFRPCEGLQGRFLKHIKMAKDLKAFIIALLLIALAFYIQFSLIIN